MAKLKKLCPELIEQLYDIKSRRKNLERDEKALVELAKKTWSQVDSKKRTVKDEEGNKKTTFTYAPKRCEFQAVLSVFLKREAKWKELFEEFYVEQFGRKAYKKFVSGLPKVEATQLDIQEVQR